MRYQEWEELKRKVDNGTMHMNMSHVFKGDFSGNKGKDACMEMFGEENDECVEYNKKYEKIRGSVHE